MRNAVTTVAELLGAVLVVAGIALIAPPAGLIAGGLVLLAAGYLGGDPPAVAEIE